MGNFNANVSGAAVEESMEHTQKVSNKKNEFDAKKLLHNFSDVLKRLMQSNWIRTN